MSTARHRHEAKLRGVRVQGPRGAAPAVTGLFTDAAGGERSAGSVRVSEAVAAGGCAICSATNLANEEQRRVNARTGRSAELARTKIGPYLDGWLEAKRHDFDLNTRKNVASHVNHSIRPVFGDTTWWDLSPQVCKNWVAGLLDGEFGPLSRATVGIKRNLFKRIVDDAIVEGYLDVNPMLYTKLPRQVRARKTRRAEKSKAIQPQEWPRFLEAFSYGPVTRLMIEVALDAQLRFGEVTNLRPRHLFDADCEPGLATPYLLICEQAIWPGKAYTRTRHPCVLQDYTKNKEDREVSLRAATYDALVAEIARRDLGPDDLLFPFTQLRAEYNAFRGVEPLTGAAVESRPLPSTPHAYELSDGTPVGHGEKERAYTAGFCGCRLCYDKHLEQLSVRERRKGRPARRQSELLAERDGREDWVSPGWWSTMWKERLATVELDRRLTFHTLRHTGCSWAIHGGASVNAMQSRLGHAHRGTTEIYIDAVTSANSTLDTSAVDALDKIHAEADGRAPRTGTVADSPLTAAERAPSPGVEAPTAGVPIDPSLVAALAVALPAQQLAEVLLEMQDRVRAKVAASNSVGLGATRHLAAVPAAP